MRSSLHDKPPQRHLEPTLRVSSVCYLLPKPSNQSFSFGLRILVLQTYLNFWNLQTTPVDPMLGPPVYSAPMLPLSLCPFLFHPPTYPSLTLVCNILRAEPQFLLLIYSSLCSTWYKRHNVLYMDFFKAFCSGKDHLYFFSLI